MADIIFADGIGFARPRGQAPENLKGKVSINVDKLEAFMKTYAKNGWVNLSLWQSKKDADKLYFSLDTWEPQRKEPVDDNKVYRSSLEGIVDYPESKGKPPFEEEIDPSSIPF